MKKRVGDITITYNKERYINEVLEGNEYGFLGYYPVIVDVGANIGTFSLSMYKQADKIYALEPVEENVECLKQTIADNNLDKITLLQMAISDHSMVSNMERSGDPGMGGWRLSESGDYPVDTRTLEDFMKSQEIEYIDLLKMDVEGEELKIFNAPYFPYQKVGTIIGEYHGGGANGTRIKERLEYFGYRYFDCGGGHFLARK